MEKFFKLKENKTNVRTEIIAGITIFMTMAYIIFVNPDILSTTGMDKPALVTATIIVAGITTILNRGGGRKSITVPVNFWRSFTLANYLC